MWRLAFKLKNIFQNCPNCLDNTLVFEETRSMGVGAGGSGGRKVPPTPVGGFSALLSHSLPLLVLPWPRCLLQRFEVLAVWRVN